MLMVLPTQFNVNPILLFSVLGRSSLSLFSYTAAGGTDSRFTPPSGFEGINPGQKRGREGGRQWRQTWKPHFTADIQLVLKVFNNKDDSLCSFSLCLLTAFLFHPTYRYSFLFSSALYRVGFRRANRSHSGCLSRAPAGVEVSGVFNIHLQKCATLIYSLLCLKISLRKVHPQYWVWIKIKFSGRIILIEYLF